MLPGFFNETMPTAPIHTIAVLRLDGDLYSSTMDVLYPLYPKVVKCGYVIVDDYGYFLQCQRAVDEYFATPQHGGKPIMHWADKDGTWFERPNRPFTCAAPAANKH